MKLSALALLLLSVVCASMLGCTSTIRASSRTYLDQEESTATLAVPSKAAIQLLVDVMRQRGFQIIDDQEGKPGTRRLKFKGARLGLTSVEVSTWRATASYSRVGSVFYAFVVAREQGSLVYVVGKPTLNGLEACSQHDRGLDPCDEVVVGGGWAGRKQMTGLDESEFVQSVLIELRHAGEAASTEQGR